MPNLKTDNINASVIGEEIKNQRKRKGLTQADLAGILDVARTTVTAIEKGERVVRSDELVKLSETFGISVHELLRVKKSVEPFKIQFRANYEWLKQGDQKINDVIDEFENLCRDYAELEELVLGNVWNSYPVEYQISDSNIERSAESIAIRERNRLGIGDGPVPMLRDILEQDVGVRIFFLDLPGQISEMYNYSEYIGGCLAINRNHPEVRRRWSMSHGYAHFLVHRKTSVVENGQKYIRHQINESFADAFAKNFLMPANSVIKKVDDIRKSKNKFTVADLFITAHYYGVSLHAMTRRLEEMKMVGSGTWDKIDSHSYSIKGEQKKLNVDDLPQRNDMLPVRYKYLAMYAFDKELISERQFAKFLRMNRVEARDYLKNTMFAQNNDLELEESLLPV